jgi:Zn-finger nucleic acid-binding protein
MLQRAAGELPPVGRESVHERISARHHGSASLNCARCGAPLPMGSSFCSHCRAPHDADLRVLARPPVRVGTVERSCPRCVERLEAWTVAVGGDGRLELDRCRSCAGLFFDPEELEAVLQGHAVAAPVVDRRRLDELLAETKPDPDRRVRYVPCPDCGALMQRKAYGARSGVVVDRCGQHGIWLDGGELRRLLHWRRAGGEQLESEKQREQQAERERAERVERRLGGDGPEGRYGFPERGEGSRFFIWLEVLAQIAGDLIS